MICTFFLSIKARRNGCVVVEFGVATSADDISQKGVVVGYVWWFVALSLGLEELKRSVKRYFLTSFSKKAGREGDELLKRGKGVSGGSE